MADNIDEKFQGLNMDLLISGPLKAAADAQIMLSQPTADFVNEVSMIDNGDGNIKASTVDFSSDRGQIDERQQIKETVLDIPILAIVKVPKLGIEEVDITFEREVKASEGDEAKKNVDFSRGSTLKINK